MQRRPRAAETPELAPKRGDAPFELGDAEWAALPDLGIPAVQARIDTGARTSALHASDIEVYAAAQGSRVRFAVYPIAGSRRVVRHCDAALVAKRWVTSSNGERELRCVVATTVEIGGRRWPIEVTLTDRGRMRHRMLLGRSAILADMIVAPSGGSRQPAIGIGVYDESVRPHAVKGTVGSLRIGLIGDGAVGPRWQGVADAAMARGHVVERIDVRRCRLLRGDDGDVRIERDGRPLPPLDAVLTLDRSDSQVFLAAVLRQAERAGAASLNPVAALSRAGDGPHVVQILWQAGLATVPLQLDAGGIVPAREAQTPGATDVSGLVVAGKVIACRRGGDETAGRRRTGPDRSKLTPAERRLMVRAAAALDLGLARVDLRADGSGRIAVAAIDAAPALDGSVWAGSGDVPRRVIEAIERRRQA